MQHFLYKMALSDKPAFRKLYVSTFVTILVGPTRKLIRKCPSGVTRRYSGRLEFEATDILVVLKGDCFIDHFLIGTTCPSYEKNGRQEHAQVLTVFRMGWQMGMRSFSKLLLFPKEKPSTVVEQEQWAKFTVPSAKLETLCPWAHRDRRLTLTPAFKERLSGGIIF